MASRYIPRKEDNTPVRCSRCGDKYPAEEIRRDNMSFYQTKRHGLVCELCHEELCEEVAEAMEDSL